MPQANIYRYSMRFRVPALDQLDCSICYNYGIKFKSDNSFCYIAARLWRHEALLEYTHGDGYPTKLYKATCIAVYLANS